jgi:four helix bundle protein
MDTALFGLFAYERNNYALGMSAPYEKLAAWRFCHDLALAVREGTRSWEVGDRFLVNQLRRASHSAASNIVEGCSKRGPREFRRFLDMSLGSLSEIEYNLRFAYDAEIISKDEWDRLSLVRRKAHGTTRLLYNAIARRAEQSNKRRANLKQ